MSPDSPAVSVDSLTVTFPGEGEALTAVDRVSFELRRGETLGIVGESGSGKSTLAMSLTRLVPAPGQVSATRMEIDGREVLSLGGKELRRLRGGTVGVVFQDPLTSLNPVLTVGRQIKEVLDLHTDLRGDAAAQRAVELLDLVGIPHPNSRVSAYPHQLSGGMRQRVAIAVAIAANPQILVADEPTTALDVTVQAQILELLGELRSELDMSILLVSHDLGVIASLADRIQVMYAGRVVESGASGTILGSPSHPYTEGLLGSLVRLDQSRPRRLGGVAGSLPVVGQGGAGCAFAPRCPVKIDRCETEAPVLDSSGGVQVACHLAAPGAPAARPVTAATEGDAAGPVLGLGFARGRVAAPDDGSRAGADPARRPLLEVRDLQVEFRVAGTGLFRKRTVMSAVDGISFEIEEGETLGLVGESGCGKSTTGRAVLRLLEPAGGVVRFDGVDLLGLSSRDLRRQRREMQMVFQDPYTSLDPRLTVADTIREPLRIHGLARGAEAEDRVAQLADAVGLRRSMLDRYPHEFSGGQRQRVAIARALAVEPRLLVCDEPSSSLDVSVQAQVINLLDDLQEQFGLTYLFISHDLGVVRHLSHRVAVMYLGRIVETAPAEDLFDRPLHPYTQALLSAVPSADPARSRERVVLRGEAALASADEGGCSFAARCKHVQPLCLSTPPPLSEAESGGHQVACHFWPQIELERKQAGGFVAELPIV